MLTLSALLLALPAAALPQDRIQYTDGASRGGRIVSATLDQVRIEADGSEATSPASDVLSIRFGTLPASLAQAQDFLLTLDYQNAVNLLDAATAEPEPAAMIARLRKAEALLAWSDLDPGQAGEAGAAFRDWTATYPDHFLLPRARIGLARAIANGGKVDQAAQELEDVASLSFEKNLPVTVEFGARLARCQVYLKGGQTSVAATRLQDLVPKMQRAHSSSDTPKGVRAALRDLIAEGQVMLGDAIELNQGMSAAQSYWDGLLRADGLGADVRAAATLGLAKAARAGGQPRRAQLLAVRVVATMPASDEISARALFLLGEITTELGDDIAAGRTYFRQVMDRYPGTPWAIKARQMAGE
ncbi:MAG: hypothetical protein H8E31_15190 [Planctomycetes bacterium]|nr:hypothetical protein [Planctomycetota bacterium]